MQRRPILPLGRWGPWVLAAVGIALVAWGLLSGNREMALAGGVAVVVFLVAFPLANIILGKDELSED